MEKKVIAIRAKESLIELMSRKNILFSQKFYNCYTEQWVSGVSAERTQRNWIKL